jgi:hypothetical protein
MHGAGFEESDGDFKPTGLLHQIGGVSVQVGQVPRYLINYGWNAARAASVKTGKVMQSDNEV